MLPDYWYVQQGFRELAGHFSRPDAHIPAPGDPTNTFVSHEELVRALPTLSRPAADVAKALLAEPRDIYEMVGALQRDGYFNRPQVSLRDLHAAGRGRGYANEDLEAKVTPVYARVQAAVDFQRRLDQARTVASIADPVWREIAREVDRAGNNDGWLSPDPHGFVVDNELERVIDAVSQRERLRNLRPGDLGHSLSTRHQPAQAVIDAYRARGPDRTTPVATVTIDHLRDTTVRAYGRELTTAATLPLTYDDRGRPNGALGALVEAVRARDGAFPESEAWLTDRPRLSRDGTAIEGVLRNLSPSDLFDFTSHGVFASAYGRDGALTLANARAAPRGRVFNQTDVLTDGAVRPMHDVTIAAYRARFPGNMQRLGDAMQAAGLTELPVAHVVAIADRLQARQRESGTTYEVHSMLGAEAHDGFRTLSLTPAQQTRLESFFRQPAPALAALTPDERAAVLGGRLTREEVGELRGIRAATRYFEQQTDLGDDFGGWTGNLLSEVYPDIVDYPWMPTGVRNLNYGQTNCLQEAHTYTLFLQQLEARGMLRYFVTSGVVSKATRQLDIQSSYVPQSLHTQWDTVHAGVLMTRRANGDSFVVDSWVDGGGSPANVVRTHQWLAGSYQASVVSAPRMAPQPTPGVNR